MKEIVCTEANWNIDLNVICPHCEHYFDVTDYITMGDLPEIGKSKIDCSIEIVCPECSRYFRITEIKT